MNFDSFISFFIMCIKFIISTISINREIYSCVLKVVFCISISFSNRSLTALKNESFQSFPFKIFCSLDVIFCILSIRDISNFIDAMLTLLLYVFLLHTLTWAKYSLAGASICSITYFLMTSFNIFTGVEAIAKLNGLYQQLIFSLLLLRIVLQFMIYILSFSTFFPSHSFRDKTKAVRNGMSEFQIPLLDRGDDIDEKRASASLYRSYWSSLFFSYLEPLLEIARSRPLQIGDMSTLPIEMKCNTNSNILGAVWNSGKTLSQALISVYLIEYLKIGLFLCLASCLNFAGPLALRQLVRGVEENGPWGNTAIFIAILVLSKAASALASTHYSCQIGKLSLSISTAIKGQLFRKIIRLSVASRQKQTVGSIVNNFTVDVERVVQACVILHGFWALPLQISVAMILLYSVVSWAMFAGLSAILLTMIVNTFTSRTQKAANDKVMEARDKRMKTTSEVFTSLLAIKLNVWEEKFREKILGERAVELKHIWTVFFVIAFNIFLLWMAPCLVSVATVTCFTKAMNRYITASEVFTALALFKTLQEPIRALPNYITQVYQAQSSMSRLQQLYVMEEKVQGDRGLVSSDVAEEKDSVTETNVLPRGSVLASGCWSWSSESQPESGTGPGEMKQKACTCPMHYKEGSTPPPPESMFRLSLPAIHLLPGQMLVVGGPVGSGKSAFLATLLSEMKLFPVRGEEESGQVVVSGSVAYSSQQNWIQHMSLRENILFGSAFDEDKYRRVLDACCLLEDLLNLPAGDATEIGEKGLNLSGGQKARVALARAVYADADVIILDDPLAALDATVGRRVLDQCIFGLLAGKTRILVSHREDISSFPGVDRVLDFAGDGVGRLVNHTTSIDSSTGSDYTKPIKSILDVPYKFENTIQFPPHVTARNYSYQTLQESNNSETQTKQIEKPEAKALLCTEVTTPKTLGAIVTAEDRETGRVSSDVYMSYLRAAGGPRLLIQLSIIQLIWQLLSVAADLYLSEWSKQSETQQRVLLNRNVIVYAVLSIGSGLLVLARTMTISCAGYRAAKTMFEQMLTSLMAAPMSWIDRNPSGRLLNRLGDDQAKLDFNLPISVGSLFCMMFALAGDMLTIVVITRYLALILLPLAIVYFRVMKMYLNASREVQRLQSISQSPVLNFVSETVSGAQLIRAFGQSAVLRAEQRFAELQDVNSGVACVTVTGSSWFILRVQLVGTVIILATALILFSGVEGPGGLGAGLVGVSLSYSMSMSSSLQNLVFNVVYFEMAMVAPERILQYIDVKPEGTVEQKSLYADIPSSNNNVQDIHSVDPLWPTKGEVRFEKVSFKYQPTGEVVLRDLSFEVHASEKIGIVGRTGAGKSSLAMCLLRIAELHKGRILIDGVDISTVSLKRLRTAVQIVPQNPVLFRGTLRSYLDPFNAYTDVQIWDVLDKVYLSAAVRELGSRTDQSGLFVEIAEGGENISVGQRQMLVLGRALLRHAKVILMDEATAAVDMETHAQLHEMLEQQFKESTVLTIAHRIDSVMSCDRVLVLSAGQLVEMGPPATLAQTPGSAFGALVQEATSSSKEEDK